MPVPAPIDTIHQANTLRKQGESISQIAATLNKPVGTIKSWLHRTKSFTVKGLADRAERVVIERLQSKVLVQESNQVRTLLAKEALQQAKTLCKGRPASRKDLATTPAGQGRTALLKQLAEASASVFGWTDDKPMGMVLIEAPRHFDDAKPIVDVETVAGQVTDAATTPDNAGQSSND